MPTIHLGSAFDNLVYNPVPAVTAAEWYAGPRKLLHWLEAQLGLSGSPEHTDYLRIELYRQALLQWRETAAKQPFYSASFDADRFATASALLSRRDELLLAGWDFTAPPGCPDRLADLAGVEAIFRIKISNPEADITPSGIADRYDRVFRWLALRDPDIDKIVLYEPPDLLLPILRRLCAHFSDRGIPVTVQPSQPAARDHKSDLAWLQGRLLGANSGKKQAAVDGSLLVLRARRDSDAAVFLAQWLAKNPDWNPVFLLPELNRVLEQAMIQEGLPAMGVLSASLARPSLQVLKLAPAFLWEPVDVFKIMEFVTLPLKPLDDGLALEIARVLAEKPGLFSDTWFAAVFTYLEQEQVPEWVREQYEFWFVRRRYRAETTAPKKDAVDLYAYLQRWALDAFEETQNTTLLVLAEQARRVRDLLETLPEQRLGFLELERIVRTIYEPAPVQLTQAETSRNDYVHQPGAVAVPADTLVWWNCLFDAEVPAPDHWQQQERAWLLARQVDLEDSLRAGQRRLMLNQRPVLQTSRRLVLIVPEQADGADALPSLLLSDIEAAFDNHNDLSFSIDNRDGRDALAKWGTLPDQIYLDSQKSVRTKPHLIIPRPERLRDSEYETPTNLEHLFYYPHRWFFRQKLRLFPASLLGVSRDQTLLGSLAHRFFEFMLQEQDCLEWDRLALRDWIDEKAGPMLEREGATLLLYGREPERNQFLNRVKNAAWSLLTLIRTNGWRIAGTEQLLEGEFAGWPVRGKADLVLHRDTGEWAIVDLKWSGARRRKEMIQNGEDLQLVLYAKLLPPPEQWAHTAYFILEEGKMVARNKEAFQDAVVAEGLWDRHSEACEAIFSKMEQTFAWRLEQLRKGLLELRNARTAPELDAIYAAEMLELLEMKTEDARWDDYRILLEGF